MNIHKVLQDHFSDKKYAMRGDSYDFVPEINPAPVLDGEGNPTGEYTQWIPPSGLEWLDESTKPTEAELQALWDAGTKHKNTIEEIKEEANRRIIAITGGGQYWREKQGNMTARFAEITRDALDSGGYSNLSTEAQAEKAALEAFWVAVKAIRSHSNTLEASVIADESPDIYAGWPA
jgi:hypothetical protein